MTRAPLTVVVAVADNGVIGRGNALPWRLPDDLRRFRALTTGHAVLMGRRTFESLAAPQPERLNLVLTRDRAWRAPGTVAVASLDEALTQAGERRLFVIGGAEVYRLCWPAVERVELTEVHAEPDGDVRLDGFDRSDWVEVAREERPADARHPHAYSFVTLRRR